MTLFVPCITIQPTPKDPIEKITTDANTEALTKYNVNPRGIAIKSKFWKNFQTLTVGFINEISEEDRNTFIRVINQWVKFINLNVVFTRDSSNAIIRIKTDAHANQSYVGTDALTAEEWEPTLFIAEKTYSTNFQSVLLHEFGHALGFEHEHLHPAANIPWDKEKVYARYRFAMTRKQIDENYFNKIEEHVLFRTDYDKSSVMHYPIDKELTDGIFEVTQNHTLSPDDMYLAMKVYPETPDY